LPPGQLRTFLEGTAPRDRLLTLLNLTLGPDTADLRPLLLEGGLLAQAPLGLGPARGRIAVLHFGLDPGSDPGA
jgi:hypothetical protein